MKSRGPEFLIKNFRLFTRGVCFTHVRPVVMTRDCCVMWHTRLPSKARILFLKSHPDDADLLVFVLRLMALTGSVNKILYGFLWHDLRTHVIVSVWKLSVYVESNFTHVFIYMLLDHLGPRFSITSRINVKQNRRTVIEHETCWKRQRNQNPNSSWESLRPKFCLLPLIR